MKKGFHPRKNFIGALIFFAVIALIIQIAVLSYEKIASETSSKARIAVLMLVVVMVLSFFCTVFDRIRRKMTVDKPVEKIVWATERMAAGDFSVRLGTAHPYGKYNEYDLIIENLNTLAEELGKSRVLKVDFISNVSHELKTPLAVIRNYAALLQSDDLSAETRDKYVKTVSRAAKRLSDLVTNILKLNKLENQEIDPENELVDLTASISQAVIEFEEWIEQKNITLDCDLDDLKIVSSPTYLEIVWNNLLSNAVKFTGAGGQISVRLKERDGNAVIAVTDTGCGISPETGARIFDKFYQGDTSHSQEGNGLGLALVKKVIDIVGGEISVSSELGKGSTFTVVLKGVEHAR